MPIIDGTEGPDTLNDTAADDQIDAKGGDDTITVTTTSVDPITFALIFDSVNGGTGSDTLVQTWGGATAAVVNDAGLSYTDGVSRGVSIVLSPGIESTIEHFVITTGSGNDNFFTLDGNDVVNLGLGNDYVRTQGGGDQVNGGAGDDLIEVGTGTDSADGGTGTDRISADMSTALVSIVWDLQSNNYSGPFGTSFTNFEYFGGNFGGLSTGGGN